MKRRVKATGSIGSWFASLSNGETLPIILDVYTKPLKDEHGKLVGLTYVDQCLDAEETRTKKFVEALQKGGRAVLAQAKQDPSGAVTLHGYNRVCYVSNVRVEEGELRLDIVGKDEKIELK